MQECITPQYEHVLGLLVLSQKNLPQKFTLAGWSTTEFIYYSERRTSFTKSRYRQINKEANTYFRHSASAPSKTSLYMSWTSWRTSAVCVVVRILFLVIYRQKCLFSFFSQLLAPLEYQVDVPKEAETLFNGCLTNICLDHRTRAITKYQNRKSFPDINHWSRRQAQNSCIDCKRIVNRASSDNFHGCAISSVLVNYILS